MHALEGNIRRRASTRRTDGVWLRSGTVLKNDRHTSEAHARELALAARDADDLDGSHDGPANAGSGPLALMSLRPVVKPLRLRRCSAITKP